MPNQLPTGKISGTFVDFSVLTHRDHNLLDWGLSDWVEELSDMRAAGIDTVIPARLMRFGAVYYFSDFFETHDERDYLTPFMEATVETGMKVFVSGMISDHYFTAGDDDFVRMMKRDLYLYETVIREVLDRYGSNGNIGGIYISHEADNVNLEHERRRSAAREFFGSLYERLKSICDVPVLSSPYFSKGVAPAELAGFWNDFIDRPMFDIIAMQDGCGCNRDIFAEDISGYYKELVPVLEQKGVEFWNNVETFSFHPGYRDSGFDRSKIWLHPAPMDRVDHQYRAGQPFAEKTITWEYGHFLSRKQVGLDWYKGFHQWNMNQ